MHIDNSGSFRVIHFLEHKELFNDNLLVKDVKKIIKEYKKKIKISKFLLR